MTTSWNNRASVSTSWGNRDVVATTYDSDRDYHFLLQESLSFLLLETGSKIRLNQFGPKETTWVDRIIP